MKIISTRGVYHLQPVEGCQDWYWYCDYASGDLYEAEELYRQAHPVQANRLVFVHYPDGQVEEPIVPREGQYFGAPVYEGGSLRLLLVDFPAGAIRIFQYGGQHAPALQAELPLSTVRDCYNLCLTRSPLALVRQGAEHSFQVLWPERGDFPLSPAEALDSREGDTLYFSRWWEDPDYREEVVLRRYPTGEVLQVIPGCLQEMPDGQRWVMQ